MSIPPGKDWQPVPVPASPAKKRRKWPWITGGVVVTFVALAIVSAALNPQKTPSTKADAASSPITVYKTVTVDHTVTAPAPAPVTVYKTVTAAPVTVYKTANVPAPPPAPAAPPAGAPSGSVTDGTFVVGQDIAAGTWHTTGQGSDLNMGCYWEKDKDLNGDFNSIIANDAFNGPATVVVDPSVKAFKTSGGCTWTRAG